MKQKKEKYLQLTIFIITIIFSFNFLYTESDVDLSIWLEWMHNVKNHGIIYGYEINDADYPPLSNAILYLVTKFSEITKLPDSVSLKYFLFITLLITSLLIFFWSRNFLFAVLSQLAFTLNVMALSYIDIFTAPFILISLYALHRKKYLLFSVFYFINVMIKWQGIIMLPFIFIYFINISSFHQLKNIELKKLLLKFVLPILILFSFILLIFRWEVCEAFYKAIHHDILSGFALNFNWIITRILHLRHPESFMFEDGIMRIISVDSTKISFIPKIMFAVFFISTIIASFLDEKNFINLLKYSIIGYLVYYAFNTGVHENHLFIPCLLAMIISIYDSGFLLQSIGIIMAFNINMFLFYGTFGNQPNIKGYFGTEISTIMSLLFVTLFVIIFFPVITAIKKKFSSGSHTNSL